MPWNLLLSTLLPIILTPNHPHAPEAHAVLEDAHAAAKQSPAAPAPDKTIAVLTRALELCLKAQSVSGASPTPATTALTEALAALVTPAP